MRHQGKQLKPVRTKAYPNEIGYTDAERTYCSTSTPAYYVVYPEIPGVITDNDYWGYFDTSDCELINEGEH